MKSKNVFYGVFFIILGVVIGLASFDLIPYYIFFPGWWTFFIIIPCAIDIIYDGNKIWNVIGLVFGLILLLSSQDLIDFEIIMKLFFPLVLVFIGFSILFKKKNNNKYEYSEVITNNNEVKDNSIKEIKNNTIYLHTFLGTNNFDLSDKKFKNDDIVKISTILGKSNIILPRNVNIKILSGSFLGDIFNKKIQDNDNKITITLDCGVFLGSIYIKD